MATATYAIKETCDYTNKVTEYSGTLDELTRRFSHSLEMGKRYDSEIDAEPKTAQSLTENLQKAAVVNMTCKRYEFIGETKRVPYWDWKNCFPECATVKGSYDAKRGTIEMILPDGIMESREKFSRREWEKLNDDRDLCKWRLKGTGVKVGWVGSNVCASYYVVATPPKTDKTYRDADGHVCYYYDPKLYVKFCVGYGPAARDKAIIKARELAATGLYNL